MKVGYQTLTWQRYRKGIPVEAVLDDIRAAGYTGVEFCESLEVLGEPKRLKEMLEERGIEMISLSCGTGNESQAKARIDYAAKFRVSALMIGGGWKPKDRSVTEDDYGTLADELENLAEYAGQYKMSVAYHPHIGTIVETAEDVERLFKYLRLTTLCPDIAHLFAAGSDPVSVIDEFGERISYVHLKDFRQPQQGEEYWKGFVELGEGNVDIADVMEKLEDLSFEGWCAVELDWTRTTPLESARLSGEYLRRLGI